MEAGTRRGGGEGERATRTRSKKEDVKSNIIHFIPVLHTKKKIYLTVREVRHKSGSYKYINRVVTYTVVHTYINKKGKKHIALPSNRGRT